jgi:hypothetical protein
LYLARSSTLSATKSLTLLSHVDDGALLALADVADLQLDLLVALLERDDLGRRLQAPLLEAGRLVGLRVALGVVDLAQEAVDRPLVGPHLQRPGGDLPVLLRVAHQGDGRPLRPLVPDLDLGHVLGLERVGLVVHGRQDVEAGVGLARVLVQGHGEDDQHEDQQATEEVGRLEVHGGVSLFVGRGL